MIKPGFITNLIYHPLTKKLKLVKLNKEVKPTKSIKVLPKTKSILPKTKSVIPKTKSIKVLPKTIRTNPENPSSIPKRVNLKSKDANTESKGVKSDFRGVKSHYRGIKPPVKSDPKSINALPKRISDLKNLAFTKTFSRNTLLLPFLLGKTFLVHNGKIFLKVLVSENIVGHKLGEFSQTRRRYFYKKGKKIKNSGSKKK